MTSIVSTTIGKTVSAAAAEALPPLTPSQQAAFRMLTEITQAVPVVVLEGGRRFHAGRSAAHRR